MLHEQRAQGGRLERLVEHVDIVDTGIRAHPRAPVRGDQDPGEIGAKPMAQLANDLNAVAIVEVVIDQEGVGFYRMLRNDCQRGFGS